MTADRKYPYFLPQATTRDDVIAAMEKKLNNIRWEADFYTKGLNKIGELSEKSFYELHWGLPPDPCVALVQCHAFGRDHVKFRFLTCSIKDPHTASDLPGGFLSDGITMSCMWNRDWRTLWVKETDFPIYIGHPYKTPYYLKLLKKL